MVADEEGVGQWWMMHLSSAGDSATACETCEDSEKAPLPVFAQMMEPMSAWGETSPEIPPTAPGSSASEVLPKMVHRESANVPASERHAPPRAL